MFFTIEEYFRISKILFLFFRCVFVFFFLFLFCGKHNKFIYKTNQFKIKCLYYLFINREECFLCLFKSSLKLIDLVLLIDLSVFALSFFFRSLNLLPFSFSRFFFQIFQYTYIQISVFSLLNNLLTQKRPVKSEQKIGLVFTK